MSNIAGQSAGAAWSTALDVDFTAQPTQAIAADGNYTIGGAVFTKFNSANEAAPMVLTNGVGIVITPAQVTTYSGVDRTLPGLFLSLPTLIPEFDLMSRLRVWLYIAADNLTANTDLVVLAAENPTAVTSFCMYKLFSGGVLAYSRRIWAGAHPGDFGSAWTAGRNVLVLHIVNSLGFLTHTGVKAAAWANPAQLYPHAAGTTAGIALATAAPLGLATAWGVMFGAGRSGSLTALAVTIGALKVEWQT